MLGEDHSLVNDFPAYQEKISQLINDDASFKEKGEKYHQLDREIRKLEVNNAPIDDEALHRMKHQRAGLKDVLYQQLTK